MVKIALIQISGNVDRQAGLEAQREWIKGQPLRMRRFYAFRNSSMSPTSAVKRIPGYLDLAETIDGPSLSAMSRCAREFRVVVVYPFFERDREGEFYNSAAVIDPRRESDRPLPENAYSVSSSWTGKGEQRKILF